MFCRCIKTFEVEFSSDYKEFSRINHQDTIFTSYVYSPGMFNLTQQTRPFYPALLRVDIVTINVSVLCSRGGGQRPVQSEGCGLLGSTRILLTDKEVHRG